MILLHILIDGEVFTSFKKSEHELFNHIFNIINSAFTDVTLNHQDTIKLVEDTIENIDIIMIYYPQSQRFILKEADTPATTDENKFTTYEITTTGEYFKIK